MDESLLNSIAISLDLVVEKKGLQEMYDEIMHQLGRQDQVLELSIRSFWNEILERMAEIAGWHQMDEEMRREHRSTAVSAVTNLLQKT